MIKLFVLDIDGCVTHPFQTPHWDSISKIRELNRKSPNDKCIPSLTLCTGRPVPYAEAVAQWLDIQKPFVFESAALYLPAENRIRTILDSSVDEDGNRINGQSAAPIEEFKRWLTEEVLPDYPNIMLEFYKMIDAGVVSPDRKQIDSIYKKIMKQTRTHYPNLEVHRTDISVNTLLAGNNKGTGVDLISREMKISPDQMAYIGDSEGDLPPLQKVKMPFAPANAIDRVKDISEVIPSETSEAVLEAYKRIIDRNRMDLS